MPGCEILAASLAATHNPNPVFATNAPGYPMRDTRLVSARPSGYFRRLRGPLNSSPWIASPCDPGVLSCTNRDFANYPKQSQDVTPWAKSRRLRLETRGQRRSTGFWSDFTQSLTESQSLDPEVMSLFAKVSKLITQRPAGYDSRGKVITPRLLGQPNGGCGGLYDFADCVGVDGLNRVTWHISRITRWSIFLSNHQKKCVEFGQRQRESQSAAGNSCNATWS